MWKWVGFEKRLWKWSHGWSFESLRCFDLYFCSWLLVILIYIVKICSGLFWPYYWNPLFISYHWDGACWILYGFHLGALTDAQWRGMLWISHSMQWYSGHMLCQTGIYKLYLTNIYQSNCPVYIPPSITNLLQIRCIHSLDISLNYSCIQYWFLQSVL